MTPERSDIHATGSDFAQPDSGGLGRVAASAQAEFSTGIMERLAYAHDASHYRLVPEAVATPSSTQAVASLIVDAGRRRTPLTFRSGGTSLSGQASTGGIIVDTRRHFRSMQVLDEGLRVRTQPGVTVRAVNARLARYGRKLGPDPASEIACTIGGVIANNSSGMACGVEQNTYQTVDSMVLVLSTGTVIDTSDPDANEVLCTKESAIYEGLLNLRNRILSNSASLATITRLYSIKNTMGYGLNSFVDYERPIDILEHLVVGSEGTLAFVAEATFNTIPVAPHSATALLFFEDLSSATASLPALVDAGFATIELLDRTSLQVAQRDPSAPADLRSLRVRNQSALLVEYRELDAEQLHERISRSSGLFGALPVIHTSGLSTDRLLQTDLWSIRKGLYASVAGSRPSGTTAILEDIAVPVERLLPTCDALGGLFAAHDYQDSVIFGHAKDGNVHFMLNEQFENMHGVHRFRAFTEDMVNLVLGQQGTLKAEHGTGRMMAPYVRRQYGDELYDVMREVKQLLDPKGVLNPGVLMNEDAESHLQHLKSSPTVEAEVDSCVECGYCEPICPSKDLTLTPRQRIVLRREIAKAEASGDTGLATLLSTGYEYSAVETCAVDSLCQVSCPMRIDTGQLVRRQRGESAAAPAREVWKFASRHWDGATRTAGAALSLGRTVAPLARVSTRLLRRVVGADAIPAWTNDLPSGGVARSAHHVTDPIGVFFPSCTNTMFGSSDGSIGVSAALLGLCDRAGVGLRIPSGIGSLCCGTPWKSKGLMDGYREMQKQVLDVLWAATDGGVVPIVSDASSCTEGLQHLVDYSAERGRRLIVIDAITFVAETVLDALIPKYRLSSLALHPTCSSTHLGIDAAMLRIATAIAEEVVVPTDWGCCAFAGDRGMLHPELTASATSRESAEIRHRSFAAYASTNRTCEMGMTRATGSPYRHLLELLEEATRPA